METSKKYGKLYWTLLILLSIFFLISGYLEITENPATYFKTLKMGYPPYFILTLGIAKFMGVVSVMQTWSKRLKEWAFAGFAFDVIFAFISGLAIASYGDCFKAAFVFFVVIVTYLLYQKKTL